MLTACPSASAIQIAMFSGADWILVSRIVHELADSGAMQARPDDADRRKRRLTIEPRLQVEIRRRGDSDIRAALAKATPSLTAIEHEELLDHLERAAALLSRAPRNEA